MDSMLSVQSALGIQTIGVASNGRRVPCEPATSSVTAILEDTAAPSTDSGVETCAIDLPDSEGAVSQTTPSEAVNSVTAMSSNNDLTLASETTSEQLLGPPSVRISVVNTTTSCSGAVCRTVSCDSRTPVVAADLNRRWGSTSLCCQSASAGSGLGAELRCSHLHSGGALDRRRWTSEFSLTTSSRTDPRAMTVTAASVGADARIDDQSSFASLSSDSKQDNGYAV